jgi:hypothetical protein
LERRFHFVVGCLTEVLIPRADGSELFGHLGTDDLVGHR